MEKKNNEYWSNIALFNVYILNNKEFFISNLIFLKIYPSVICKVFYVVTLKVVASSEEILPSFTVSHVQLHCTRDRIKQINFNYRRDIMYDI